MKIVRRKKIIIFLTLVFVYYVYTEIKYINIDSFDYDKNNRTICLDHMGSLGRLSIPGWKIYEQTYERQVDENTIELLMHGDPECKRYNEKIRYIVGYDTTNAFSIIGCINFIGGGSGSPTNYHFYIKDTQSGKKVFRWSKKGGCDTFKPHKTFYQVLFKEMIKPMP